MALPRVIGAARRGLAVLAMATVLAGTAACASTKVYREGTATITGKAGEHVIVELAADPTTGYSWMVVAPQPDPRIATLVETDFMAGPTAAPGVAGYQRWTFRLVSPGSTIITFGYGRTWEHVPAQKATMFTITVR